MWQINLKILLGNTMIIIDKLNLKYGQRVILDDISMNINEKDFVVITGESGCG